MQITVNYQMTPEEYERGLKQVVRKRRLIVKAVIPFLLALGWLYMASTQVEWGFLAFILAMFYASMLVAGPRIVATKGAPRHCLPTEMTFATEGYILRTPLIKTEARWQMLDRTEETREFFLFHTGIRRAMVVPKRAFSAEQAAELRAFLPGAPMGATLPPVSESATTADAGAR